MLRKIVPFALAGAASAIAFGASAQMQSSQLSQTCRFNSGPRAGQTVNYTGSPGAASVRIGSRCADMQGSSGSAVAQDTARARSQGRYFRSAGAPNAWEHGQLRRGYSQTCKFNSGPEAGSSKDFAGTLGAQPVAVGAPCSDGSSRGVAIAHHGR